MDDVIQQFFTVPVLVFCLGIWVLVMVQRKLVEYFWKTAKQSRLWNDLVLPLAPIITGVTFAALVSHYPFPDSFKSLGARIFFGLVCGLGSAHIYKIIKKFLTTKEDKPSSEDDLSGS